MERNDIIKVLERYDIDHWTHGKNVSDNSVNVQCPYCDDHSNHCGIFHPSGLFNCWRCSTRGPFSRLLSTLTRLPEEQLEEYLKDQGVNFQQSAGDQLNALMEEATEEITGARKTRTTLPKHARKVTEDIWAPRLKIFLKERNISIITCIKHCCLVCDVGDYAGRLIVPVFFKDNLVSFQGIDMTGQAYLKHKTAPGDINEYLYGYDTLPDHVMVVVEGMFDKWRVGIEAVASFGTSLTSTQKNLIIAKKPDVLVFAWDGDCWFKAKKHAEYFSPFIKKIKVVNLPQCEDPDSYGSKYGKKALHDLINQTEVM